MTKNSSQDRLDEWIKKTKGERTHYQGKQPAQHNVPHRTQSHSSHQSNTALLKRDAEITKLKNKLHSAKTDNANMRKQRDERIDAKQTASEDKGMHAMTNGYQEDRFDKVYHPHYLDSNNHEVTYDLHVVLRPVTMADSNEIAAQEEVLTNDMGRYFEVNSLILLRAFVTMRVAGIEVPEAFKDPKKLNRINLLMQVYSDFLHWEDNFRSHQKI